MIHLNCKLTPTFLIFYKKNNDPSKLLKTSGAFFLYMGLVYNRYIQQTRIMGLVFPHGRKKALTHTRLEYPILRQFENANIWRKPIFLHLQGMLSRSSHSAVWNICAHCYIPTLARNTFVKPPYQVWKLCVWLPFQHPKDGFCQFLHGF